MSGDVFIRLYLDEDIDVLIADLIRPHGFEIVTTMEVARKSKSDPEQLEYATTEKFTIVTHNRSDFEQLAQKYFDSGQTHYGIIISVQRISSEIVRRLLKILNTFTADEAKNQVYYI